MLHGLPQCKYCHQKFASWRNFHVHIPAWMPGTACRTRRVLDRPKSVACLRPTTEARHVCSQVGWTRQRWSRSDRCRPCQPETSGVGHPRAHHRCHQSLAPHAEGDRCMHILSIKMLLVRPVPGQNPRATSSSENPSSRVLATRASKGHSAIQLVWWGDAMPFLPCAFQIQSSVPDLGSIGAPSCIWRRHTWRRNTISASPALWNLHGALFKQWDIAQPFSARASVKQPKFQSGQRHPGRWTGVRPLPHHVWQCGIPALPHNAGQMSQLQCWFADRSCRCSTQMDCSPLSGTTCQYVAGPTCSNGTDPSMPELQESVSESIRPLRPSLGCSSKVMVSGSGCHRLARRATVRWDRLLMQPQHWKPQKSSRVLAPTSAWIAVHAHAGTHPVSAHSNGGGTHTAVLQPPWPRGQIHPWTCHHRELHWCPLERPCFVDPFEEHVHPMWDHNAPGRACDPPVWGASMWTATHQTHAAATSQPIHWWTWEWLPVLCMFPSVQLSYRCTSPDRAHWSTAPGSNPFPSTVSQIWSRLP